MRIPALVRPALVGLALVACACSGGKEASSSGKAVEAGDAGADPADPSDSPPPPDPTSLAAAVASGAARGAPRPEHPVWYLGPNRDMAHRIVDGDLVVDAGAPGFARYTRFGLPVQRWRHADVDGEPAADPRGGASLDLPLTAAQAQAARSIALRVHAAKAGAIAVKVAGRKLPHGRVDVVEGWQTVAVPVDGRLVEGENMVVIEAGTRVQIRWIRVAAAEADAAAALPDPLARAGWDAAKHGFTLSDAAGLAWYVEVPTGAALVADVAGDCKAEVAAKDGDGTFVGGLLAGPAARIDLAPLAGKVVRLEVAGRDCPRGGLLSEARIVLPGDPPSAPPTGDAPKYVIFWVMDATRADKIPTFTPGARAETPNFDRLAKDGAVFRQHYVGGNESQVSHTSMFTSLYPATHGVRTAGNDIKYRIPTKYPTLGRLMHDGGFYTMGVTANGFIGEWGGYARGFEEFRNMMQEKGVVNGVLFGAQVVDEVIRRITQHVPDGKPLFMFLGTVDNHSPWIGRAPWLDRYDPGPYDGPFQERGTAGPLGLMKGKMGCHKVPPARDIERLRAIYDSAISYQDALIGDLLAALEKLGIADQTMLVITADHGDELFEEHRCGHGATLRDSLARVPLIIHYPGRVPGRIVEEGSEGVDILPTILDIAGLPIPEHLQGRSLRGLAAGDGAGWAQPSFASQYEYAFAMRIGRWKARVGRTAVPMVLDMVADPEERVDLAAKRPFERRYLTDHLGLYMANRTRWHKATWGVVSNLTEAGAQALEQGGS